MWYGPCQPSWTPYTKIYTKIRMYTQLGQYGDLLVPLSLVRRMTTLICELGICLVALSSGISSSRSQIMTPHPPLKGLYCCFLLHYYITVIPKAPRTISTRWPMRHHTGQNHTTQESSIGAAANYITQDSCLERVKWGKELVRQTGNWSWTGDNNRTVLFFFLAHYHYHRHYTSVLQEMEKIANPPNKGQSGTFLVPSW